MKLALAEVLRLFQSGNLGFFAVHTADPVSSLLQIVRNLPWRTPTNGKRVGESVRPVFWANRPAAYVKRTADWDACAC